MVTGIYYLNDNEEEEDKLFPDGEPHLILMQQNLSRIIYIARDKTSL